MIYRNDELRKRILYYNIPLNIIYPAINLQYINNFAYLFNKRRLHSVNSDPADLINPVLGPLN